jgi:hypothetical protein
MSKQLKKLQKKIEYMNNANEKYYKFVNFKMHCGICKSEINLQIYNIHLKSKKCRKIQALIYNDEIRDSKLQLLKDKIYFLKYGPEEITLSDMPNITEDDLNVLMDLKNELNSNDLIN